MYAHATLPSCSAFYWSPVASMVASASSSSVYEHFFHRLAESHCESDIYYIAILKSESALFAYASIGIVYFRQSQLLLVLCRYLK